MNLKSFVRNLLNREPETATEWAERGDALIKKNRLEDAVVQYDEALARDPDNLQALRGKGYATRRMADIEAAKICYERIVTLAPDDMKAWLAKGYVHSIDGDMEKALQCYNRVLEKDPKNITAASLKFFIITDGFSHDELDKALREFEREHPGFVNGFAKGILKELIISELFGFTQGDEVLISGDTFYATPDIRELEKNWPQIREAGRRMAQDFAGSDSIDITSPEAISDPSAFRSMLSVDSKELEDLRKRQPGGPASWFDKGDSLCRHSDNGLDLEDEVRQDLYREAGLCFDRVLASHPAKDLMILGLAGKGYTAMRLWQYSDALSCFEEAVRLAPEDAACWKGKAHALSNLGRAQDTIACFEKAQEIQDQADPHHMIWMTSRKRGYVISRLLS